MKEKEETRGRDDRGPWRAWSSLGEARQESGHSRRGPEGPRGGREGREDPPTILQTREESGSPSMQVQARARHPAQAP